MRKRSEIENQIIHTIGEAVRIRRVYIRQNLPEHGTCIIGKQIIIPNDLRSNEDIQEDEEYRNMMIHGDTTVDTVYGLWFKVIDPFEQAILELKCSGRKSFKTVSRELTQRGYTDRNYTVRRLSYLFNTGISKISMNFFN